MSTTTASPLAAARFTAPQWLTRWAQTVRDYPQAGWTTVVLAATVAGIVVWSVENAHWVPVLPGVVIVSLVGAAFGLVNAQSRRLQIAPHVIALVVAVGQSLAHTATLVGGTSVEGRVLTAIYRMALWGEALWEGGASTDRLAFVFLLLLISWLVTYVTVFLTLRTLSVWALLPAGFAITSNLTYLPPRELPWFMAFLVLAAMLIVRLVYLERRKHWNVARASQGAYLPAHVFHAGVWFAVIVFVATLVAPSVGSGPTLVRQAWAELRGPVGDAEGTFSRIFASLPARRSMALYGFGNELPFRGNVSLSDDVVMLVESDEKLYWRARTYDAYHSWGWSNGSVAVDERRGLADIAGEGFQNCPECVRTITFDLQSPSHTVVTAATPLRTTLPVEAIFTHGNTDEGNRLVKLTSRRALQPNQRYTVQVYVPTITVADLNGASTDYGPWVQSTYLTLPEEAPRQVVQLAERVTDGADTPYEKAIALRDFLRTYDYSQDIPAPPPGRDAIAHFLFVEQAGYSDYFGSAMTVLLRAAGVPSRLAVGYLPGEFDSNAGAYVVLESDAHAWSEAYFPGYGWVPFEPTPNRDAQAPGGPVDGSTGFADLGINAAAAGDLTGFAFEDEDLLQTTPDILNVGDEDNPASDGALLGRVLRVGGTTGGLILGLGVLLAGLLLWRRGLARPRTAVRAYTQTVRLGRLAGLPARLGETPEEYVDRLAAVIPNAADSLHAVAEWYGHTLYGPEKDIETASPIAWGSIVWGTLSMALRRLFPGRRGRIRRSMAHEG